MTMPDDSVLFRSDFPEYHSEYVGCILSELTNSGYLIKLSQGIYAKPRISKFGIVLPSVDKIVQAIAHRDKAEILPSGMTALNTLGLSTQVPVNYTYITSGSERLINLDSRKIYLKRAVPKNFSYKTRLAALLVQASKALKQENFTDNELEIISALISKEPDIVSFKSDVSIMPAWIKRTLKPLINS